MKKTDKLEKWMVVQLSPNVSDSVFAGLFMVVTEVKEFGAKGVICAPENDYHYRATWDEMEIVGRSPWITTDCKPGHAIEYGDVNGS